MSGSIITTDTGTQYQKAGFWKTAAGVAVGYITADYTKKTLSTTVNTGMKNILANEPLDEFAKEAEEAFKNSGLPEKGIEWLRETNPENIKKLVTAKTENFDKETDKFRKLFKSFPVILTKIEEKRAKDKQELIKFYEKWCNDGPSFFATNENLIFCDLKRRSRYAFHEMGHALDAHGSPAIKKLMSLRCIYKYATIPLIFALLKREKVEGEKPKGFFDTVTTFIKNHAGILAFSLWIPCLAEEALASINGYKLAKKVCSPEKLKKLPISMGKAWLTYFGAAAATGIGTFFASKVRDTFAKPQKLSYFDTVYTKVSDIKD